MSIKRYRATLVVDFELDDDVLDELDMGPDSGDPADPKDIVVEDVKSLNPGDPPVASKVTDAVVTEFAALGEVGTPEPVRE